MDMHVAGGRVKSAAMKVPRGHHDDPMSDAEVNAKFRQLALRKLPPERVERALEFIWTIDASPSAGEVFDLFRID